MPTVTINGREVAVPQGTTILRAAELVGVEVPYFCYHPGLSIPANCRMCLVEIEGARKLEPSCYTQVRDGMVVHTESEQVNRARESVLEFILVSHPVDCPICDQAGECWLQDHYLDHDGQQSRVRTAKVAKQKVVPVGPNVVLDQERCILCTRCVRFCDEITQTHELTTVERGDQTEITTFPGTELDNAYSLCTADICPVGALTNRQTRFKRRAWRLQSTPSICTGCSRNCAVHLDHFQQEPERYLPRFNPDVNEYWMCDAGRETVEWLKQDRLTEIVVNGDVYPRWSRALRPIADAVAEVEKWALVLSPQQSTESLAAAVEFAETALDGATLFRNGLSDGDEDDFLIRSDKNPNNAGLDLVTKDHPALDLEALIAAVEEGSVTGVWMLDPAFDIDETALREALGAVDLFVLHGIWTGKLSGLADIQLPAASHAEQEGTWVNCDGIAQQITAACPCPGNGIPAWEAFAKIARIMRKPMTYKGYQSLFERLAIEVYEPGEDLHPGDFRRAPHGPDRAIPGRTATAHGSIPRRTG